MLSIAACWMLPVALLYAMTHKTKRPSGAAKRLSYIIGPPVVDDRVQPTGILGACLVVQLGILLLLGEVRGLAGKGMLLCVSG